MRLKWLIILIICAVSWLAMQIVDAQGVVTYLDNTVQSSEVSKHVFSDLYAQFETGTNTTGYMLNSIEMVLVGGGGPGDFTVQLATNSFGIPGISLVTLVGNNNPTGPSFYSYTDSSNTTLSPNTYYWILASDPNTSEAFNWYGTGEANATTSGGWSMTGEVYDPNNPFNPNPSEVETGFYQMFAVNATPLGPVPEPSIAAMLAVGSLGALLLKRAKNCKRIVPPNK